jgi:CheY-like chemotaxis protein
LRVLIADDEDAVRRTLSTYFKMQGAEVLQAADGREALDVIEQHHMELDLVILDTVMPKLSGADCLRALRQLAPELPVVMASGYLKDVALHDLEDLGIGAFLSKPFRLAQLGAAVEAALAGARITAGQ